MEEELAHAAEEEEVLESAAAVKVENEAVVTVKEVAEEQ